MFERNFVSLVVFNQRLSTNLKIKDRKIAIRIFFLIIHNPQPDARDIIAEYQRALRAQRIMMNLPGPAIRMNKRWYP